MPFSYHSHSGQFCLHANGTLQEMVEAAIARKMEIFALTEHMPRDQEADLYPEEIAVGRTPQDLFEVFKRFHQEARDLQNRYSDQITILVGFESEWIRPSSRIIIEELLRDFQFDILIGSVHHVNSIPIDFDAAMYQKARESEGGTDEALFNAYFDAQHDMLQAILPCIVGHFDLIRLKSDHPNYGFRQMDDVWSKIRRNLSFIASYGGVLEINTSSLRKGMTEPYPNAEICKEFLGMGGKFVLSDDSHSVEQVGLNYQGLLSFLAESEIPEIHVIKPCDSLAGGKQMLSTTKCPISDLKGHSFWK